MREAVQRKLPANQTSLLIVGDAQVLLSGLRAKYPNAESVALTQLNLDRARWRSAAWESGVAGGR